jgi:membrane-associated protease RseP (regulator of RpoE activity)
VLIAKLFLGILLALIVHLGAMALTGVLLGATLKQVSLGFGPTVRKLRLRGAELTLRLFPLGGYVQFWRSDDPEPPPSLVLFDRLPGYQRAAVQLAGPLALFAVGSALAGSLLWKPAVDGAVDIIRGALSPTSTGADLLAEGLAAMRTRPLLALLGLVLAKVAAWNLLPFPTLNGGAALLDLTVPAGKRGDRARTIAAATGTIVLLALCVTWIVALVTFVRRGAA